MDSWNNLCIGGLHAQLIYSFAEWTLITDREIRGFNRIRPEIRLHTGYCMFVCVREKHTLRKSVSSHSQTSQAPKGTHFPSCRLCLETLTTWLYCICSSGLLRSHVFILNANEDSRLDKWDVSPALPQTNVCWVAVDECEAEWSRMIIKMSINLSSHMADVDT